MKSVNLAAGIAVAVVIVSGAALAASECYAQSSAEALKAQLIGSWRLVTYRAQREGEKEWRETLGASPKGYAIFTREGRYMHLIVAGGRTPPANDAERAALLNSMTAWSGRYDVVGKDEFHVAVDTSWSETHRGERQNQVRFVRIEGDRMTLLTPPQVGARATTRTDKPNRSVTEFVFEREK